MKFCVSRGSGQRHRGPAGGRSEVTTDAPTSSVFRMLAVSGCLTRSSETGSGRSYLVRRLAAPAKATTFLSQVTCLVERTLVRATDDDEDATMAIAGCAHGMMDSLRKKKQVVTSLSLFKGLHTQRNGDKLCLLKRCTQSQLS